MPGRMSFLGLLFKYPNCVGLILLGASFANAVLRFDGSFKRFFTMVVVQVFFGQGVWNYLCGRRIAIGPSSLGKSSNPEWRALLASFAFGLYMIVFFLGF
ncbi:hypothetical protein [Pseudomonas fluorescens]|uniref:hypothetical protein n=1 Tax=Pseudomonas fluorescens TaxID=294 RepID=UPI00124129E9|nr:hypothetical protein [Pseudomonas fluorescens]VVQ36885.1 hypothetical protein PS947_05293 [Pseudomonas fluorescens]